MGLSTNGPHEDRYYDRRPVTTEKKFSVSTQAETCAAQEQQGGWGVGWQRGFEWFFVAFALRGRLFAVQEDRLTPVALLERGITPWAPLSPAEGIN